MLAVPFLIALQMRGTSVVGKVFKLLALGSAGSAECSVNLATGSDLDVKIHSTFRDFAFTHSTNLVGEVLIINIRITPQ